MSFSHTTPPHVKADLKPLQDLDYDKDFKSWWRLNEDGVRCEKYLSLRSAVKDIYKRHEVPLPKCFTYLYCQWCRFRGVEESNIKTHQASAHQPDGTERRAVCEHCCIAWTGRHHNSTQCPVKGTAEELAGRTWCQKELAYRYELPIIKRFAFGDEGRLENVDKLRDHEFRKRYDAWINEWKEKLAQHREALKQWDAGSEEAQALRKLIQLDEERIEMLKQTRPPTPSASLSKSPASLSSRRRVIYGEGANALY